MPILRPMTTEQLTLLQQWHAAKAAVETAEAFERDLRNKVVDAFFGDYGEGSRTADVGNGWKLQNTNAITYYVANKPEMVELQQRFAAHGETAEAGKTLLNWKPNLSVKAYKALPLWGRGMFDQFVTTKSSLAQLKLTQSRD